MEKLTSDSVGRYARALIYGKSAEGIIVTVDTDSWTCTFLSENNEYFGGVLYSDVLEIGNKIGGETGLPVGPVVFFQYCGVWYCAKNGKIYAGDTPEQARYNNHAHIAPREMALELVDTLLTACENSRRSLQARRENLECQFGMYPIPEGA